MKKITFVTMQLQTPGGIERFISTLASMFSDKYHVEIVVNYGQPSGTLAFPLPKNIKITYLSPNKPQEISLKTLILNFNWFKIPPELKRRFIINRTRKRVFKKYLTKLDTDYLITDRTMYNSLVGKYYRGTALKIATDHNHHQNNKKYINELHRSLKYFNVLIVPTRELKDFYQPLFKTIRCCHIPIPIDTIPTRKSLLNTKNILSIGRFVPEKDFSALIKVMSVIHQKDPNIHLTIIGDGKEMPLIKNQIRRYHLEKVVDLPGWLSQKTISKYYYDSSIFVLTSRTEAFGLVLLEAMSHGLPCIAFSRASGASAQLAHGIGYLINHEDTDAMATTIINLLQNPQTLKKQQEIINKHINNYSKDKILKNWLNILQ